METLIKQYRASLKAIFPPVFYSCFGVGLILFIAIFIKEDFVYSYDQVDAILIFLSVMIPFITLILLAVTFTNKVKIYNDGIFSKNSSDNEGCDFLYWSIPNHFVQKS